MNEIRVYFNNFWSGFLEGTNPNTVYFFVELFKRVFNSDIHIECNYNDADILCENAASNESSLIYKKQWKYSFLVTGESVISFGDCVPHYNKYTCFLSGLQPSIHLKRVKFPLFISYLFCNNTKSLPSVASIPDKLVCAIIGNPKGKVRNKFLDKLEEKTRVAYGGSFRNNIGYCIGGDHNSSELINFMREYKFVITMENNEEDYYITEKICNGFFAGIVPIYWGSPNIGEYFNKNRFLHLTNDSDIEIERIINTIVNMTDETYIKMINIPILVNSDLIEPLVNDIKSTITYTSI